VPYAGRTAHIHYQVKARGQEVLTTQLYIKGNPGNERDGIWKRLGDQKVRDLVTVDFAPLPGATAGELAARFDLVLGTTPEA
jgi:protocatechuate 3,4-dioxygenase beta subunit